MYAVPNSGWWYDAGFLLGMVGSMPLGWIAALMAIVQYVRYSMSAPIGLDAAGRPGPLQPAGYGEKDTAAAAFRRPSVAAMRFVPANSGGGP